MSLAREMSRGFFLKARLGVKGSQNALKSLGKSLGTPGRGAGFTAVAVVMRSVSLTRLLARTMAAAPLFVQFSVIGRPHFAQSQRRSRSST